MTRRRPRPARSGRARARRPLTPVVGLGAALVILAACGSDGAAEDTSPERLTLVAYSAFARPDALDEFTATTGIEVEVVDGGDTGTMVAKAVLTAGAPEGDVMWGVDDASITRVLEADVFAEHEPAELAALDPALTGAVPYLTPVDVGDVCLNYDVAWFRDAGLAPPASFADLIDPAYRDLLVVQNPASSSPGLAFLLATIAELGESGYVGYWEALAANGVEVVDDWDTAYYSSFTAGGGDGDRPVVVSYASSPPATIVFAEDPKPTEPTTATVAATCYRVAEYAGVLAGTEYPTAAGELVDFLVTDAFQAELPLTNFVYPARLDVTLPDVFATFAPRPADVLRLDPELVADRRTDWVDAWTNAVLR